MSNGDLKDVIGGFDERCSSIMISASLVILFTMSIVFIQYFRLSQQQVKELERIKQEAAHANMAKANFYPA